MNYMHTLTGKMVARSLVVAAAMLVGSAAWACSCVPRTDEQKFRDAKTVVVGVVVETRYIEDEKVFGGGYIKAKVRVSEVVKGKAVRSIAVQDQVGETGMCSSFLLAGAEYVLFIDDRQEVGLCSGTRRFGATIYDRPEKLMELQRLKKAAEQRR